MSKVFLNSVAKSAYSNARSDFIKPLGITRQTLESINRYAGRNGILNIGIGAVGGSLGQIASNKMNGDSTFSNVGRSTLIGGILGGAGSYAHHNYFSRPNTSRKLSGYTNRYSAYSGNIKGSGKLLSRLIETPSVPSRRVLRRNTGIPAISPLPEPRAARNIQPAVASVSRPQNLIQRTNPAPLSLRAQNRRIPKSSTSPLGYRNLLQSIPTSPSVSSNIATSGRQSSSLLSRSNESRNRMISLQREVSSITNPVKSISNVARSNRLA